MRGEGRLSMMLNRPSPVYAILLVAISQREVGQLKELVAEVDPDAFIIIGSAAEELGQRFKKAPMRR